MEPKTVKQIIFIVALLLAFIFVCYFPKFSLTLCIGFIVYYFLVGPHEKVKEAVESGSKEIRETAASIAKDTKEAVEGIVKKDEKEEEAPAKEETSSEDEKDE